MAKTAAELLDELLVLQSQDGDSIAFGRLASRWQKRLWTHAFRLTQDSSAAWDVLQESWIAIIKALPKLTDPGAFPTWAFRITGRQAANWYRQRARQREQPITSAAESMAPETRSPYPADDLNHLLGCLSFEHREILLLHYVQGLTVEQIAELLEAPQGTIKSRLHYARENARRIMEDHDHA